MVQIMQAREITLGEGHPDTLTSMGNLASMYQNQRQLNEVEGLESQAMERSNIELGLDHSDTLTSSHNPRRYVACAWTEGRSNSINESIHREAFCDVWNSITGKAFRVSASSTFWKV